MSYITQAQQAIGSGSSTSPSAAFGSLSGTGSLLVAVLAVNSSGGVTPTMTGWTLAASLTGTGGNDVWIYVQPNALAQTTITGSISASHRWIFQIIEYYFAATSSVVNAFVTGTTTASNPVASPSITSTANWYEVVFAFSGNDGTSGSSAWSSPNNGFSIVNQTNNGNPITLCTASNTYLASGTQQCSIAEADSPACNVVGVALLSSGAIVNLPMPDGINVFCSQP